MHAHYGLENLFDNGHSNNASQALPIPIFFDAGSHILVNVTWYNITKTTFFVCVGYVFFLKCVT